MNYNNNYVEHNVHDRRKANNVNNTKENESWNNMSYGKSNQMHVMNRQNVDSVTSKSFMVSSGKDNNNDRNNSSREARNNDNKNIMHNTSINSEHTNETNINMQVDSNNFMYNYNNTNPNDHYGSNPNDHYANNPNSNVSSSNYVSTHPIFGRKKVEAYGYSFVSNSASGNILNTPDVNSNVSSNNVRSNNVSSNNVRSNNVSSNNVRSNNVSSNNARSNNVSSSNASNSYSSIRNNEGRAGNDNLSGNVYYLNKDSYNMNMYMNNHIIGGSDSHGDSGSNNYIMSTKQIYADSNLMFNKNIYNSKEKEGPGTAAGADANYHRSHGMLSKESKSTQNSLEFINTINYENEMNKNKMSNALQQPFKNDNNMVSNKNNFFFSQNVNNKEDSSNKGIMHNIIESLTNNVQTNNEINNLVKQRVANMVMNELEKKIEINNETSFIGNKLSLLRGYFDVTHSYVIHKILFILMPYIYIRKALCESRTYYVYNHLKRKMESTQQDKTYGSAFILNGNNNTHYNNGKSEEMTNKMKMNSAYSSENKPFFYNEKKSSSLRLIRNNSNDINYVDYSSNIGIFKADLYIPLMSSITYILLYTLTVTAQKNNFTFNPDNLFNISSYVFILLFLETALIKFMFLLVCRDINLSFLHILSFISYKFVIMCALIITKIFFYFMYFMYTSAFGQVDDNMNKMQEDKKLVLNNPQVFKNLNNNNSNGNNSNNSNGNNVSFNFSPFSIILFLNSNTMYRLTQLYFYITVSMQMIQIFKSIHLYIHDNSNLLNNFNIKRINILILIFSFSQIFLCWILTPYFT
ncbi:C-13 antigen, putative [Plasmodium malariae]|uniref:C-13 antigen, putative n=1 Tax=Plasmodium malariae TaxID=5858 RepID=A0A1D3JLP5_PLAMA|nr:C-13 antigen, putative [Plasmodium malariae]SBT87393.1 C-13 antigen, putative [Plasmodium malariae]